MNVAFYCVWEERTKTTMNNQNYNAFETEIFGAEIVFVNHLRIFALTVIGSVFENEISNESAIFSEI